MNTKLIVALVIVGVLAIFAVGLVSAQVATSKPNGTTTNGSTVNSFFCWMERCIGFRGAQNYGTGTSSYGTGRCGMMGSFP